jgi:diaminopimelate epimerase
MGRATFRSGQIPATGPDREIVGEPVEAAGERLRITAVSVGNPHCVAFRERLDEAECRRLGPALERHAAFPARTNVQLVRVETPARLAVLVWERGAGWTLASGSSSCAVAAAAVRTGRARPGRIAVGMPGGTLAVDVRPDWSLRLEGPVAEAWAGTLADEFARDLFTA